MTQKICSVFLAVILLLISSGCRTVHESSGTDELQNQPEQGKTGYMHLAYSVSDSFNPYLAETPLNRELCGLLYDSLIKLDEKFNPVYGLAADVKAEDSVLRVDLKDAFFSDGSPVTSEDVVHSFNLAKASKTKYAGNLYIFSSASAEGSRTVIFSAVKKDPFAINLLDFPVIKKGSEEIADKDGVIHPPTGCGRYILNSAKNALIRNERYYGRNGSTKEIKLINAPDPESLSHYVEIGATDIYFTDISDGNIVRMSGRKKDINLTDFVYIGINGYNETLSIPEIRYAISSAIDRKSICQTAYFNNALSASGFFHPEFEKTSALQNIKSSSDFKIAIENLNKIGYNNLNGSGIRTDKKGKRLSFTLLVNSENTSRLKTAELIAEQLRQTGIEIKTVSKSFSEYKRLLESGNFEIYLGEVRLTANMDFSPLILPGGSATYGIKQEENSDSDTGKPGENTETDQNRKDSSDSAGETENNPGENAPPQDGGLSKPSVSAAAQILTGFYSGQYSVSDVASVLLTELPCIPVCYRSGLLFYDDDFVNLQKASQSDIYFSNETGHIPDK